MPEIIDLDVLRPQQVVVELAGKQIDVSYIPVGITFDVDAIVQKMVGYTEEMVQAGGDAAREALDLSIRLCSVFCSVKYSELDEEWFRTNVSSGQLQRLAQVISETLMSSYNDMEGYQKNVETVQVPTK